MVVIKSVSAKTVLDSRKEKTILVSIKTSNGKFFASAPNGKSRWKAEKNPYKKSLEKDIEALKKFSAEEDGAVTVEYVVLTSAAIFMAIFVMGIISQGAEDLATKVSNDLSSM